MSKYLIQLSSKDKEYLENLINNDKVNSKARIKAKVILLRALKKDIATIITETKLSKRTIINYTNEYVKSNTKQDFLFKNNYNKSELCKYQELILNEFHEKPPLTYSEGALRIESITGIKKSQTQVRKFLDSKRIYTRRTIYSRELKFIVRRKIELKFKAMSDMKN